MLWLEILALIVIIWAAYLGYRHKQVQRELEWASKQSDIHSDWARYRASNRDLSR